MLLGEPLFWYPALSPEMPRSNGRQLMIQSPLEDHQKSLTRQLAEKMFEEFNGTKELKETL